MTHRFDISDTPLPGLRLLHRKPVGDHRGFLQRMYCAQELAAVAPGKVIVQINHALTVRRGTVRGMHFQRPPHAETKFVSCLRGEVFDVAVDIRPESQTFLCWHAEILSADNHNTLMIPEGFAHGFQTLTEDCEMLYFHTAAFQPEFELGLNPQDPKLDIRWPVPVADLSIRDAGQPAITDQFGRGTA